MADFPYVYYNNGKDNLHGPTILQYACWAFECSLGEENEYEVEPFGELKKNLDWVISPLPINYRASVYSKRMRISSETETP